VAEHQERGEVIVVGSINIDLIALVARLPRPGQTVTGGVFERQGGGKSANQAVAAARVGARVRFVGAVGDDDAGRQALAGLRAEGLITDGVVRLAGVATGVALIVVDAAGENQIAVASGANAALTGEQVTAGLAIEAPRAGAICVIGFEVGDEAVLAAATWAAKHRLTCIVNPAPARPLPAGLAGTRPLLTPNLGEAVSLSGEADPEAAAIVLRYETRAPVLVTMGSEGVIIADDAGIDRLPALTLEALDTTGAGDAFNGILAAELARGAPLREATRWAIVGAGLSTRRQGARAGLPTRAEIAAVLSASKSG
jgi:ribokinase